MSLRLDNVEDAETPSPEHDIYVRLAKKHNKVGICPLQSNPYTLSPSLFG